jgi:DNA modification methylase
VFKLKNLYEDILSQLQDIEDNSIQAIVSRPPIFQRIFSSPSFGDLMEKYKEHLKHLDEIWRGCYRVLKETGSMWIICDDYLQGGQLLRLPFNLAKRIQSSGFLLRNLIIWYNLEAESITRDFVNRYTWILFFAKSKTYKFNLDAIREPHIWKDVEWGGGRRSRYNPRGKNPSNVWLKTESEKGKTLRHIPLSLDETITRCILASSDENDCILDIFAENAPTQKISRKLNRIPKACFSRVRYSLQLPTSEVMKGKNIHTVQRPKKFVRALYFKSSEKMDEVPDSSVQLIITSPPYWGLRDYGVREQIGFAEPYEEYLERLNKVWKECYRVLHPTGSLWININKRIIGGQMLLFPEDIAQTVSDIGFFLKEIVIWHKPIFVPTTGPKNFTDRHEYVLFFTKSKRNYLFKADEIKQVDYLHAGSEKLGNIWKIYRKIGNIGKPVEVMIAEKKVKHTAVYPNELVERIVLLCSNEGNIVLDPFAGSGTTLIVANKLGRQWIGYEINPDYKVIIDWRLKNEGGSLSPWLYF